MIHIGGKQNELRSRLKPLAGDVRGAFTPAVDRIRGILLRAADADGVIDPRRDDAVIAQVGEVVMRLFVGENGRSAYDADGVTPLAPFPELLNRWYVRVVMAEILPHRDYMKAQLPEDVYQWLAGQRGFPSLAEAAPAARATVGEEDNPFLRRRSESLEAHLKRLNALRIFRPNPLAEFDPKRRWVPMHRWNTPDGYRLSDRIWQSGVYARTEIDRLCAQFIREGGAAMQLSQQVEQYLLPHERLRRTQKPYHRDAAFSAMRLARTEIGRSANFAAYTAAWFNPYVDRIDVARSPGGDPTCRICPAHATIGIMGERLRDPYPVDQADFPVFHPQCMCHVRPVVSDPARVTRELRAFHDEARREYLTPIMTPAAETAFLQALLGAAMMQLLAQAAGRLAGN